MVSLLIVEAGLRFAGYRPLAVKEYAKRVKTTQFHSLKGWELKVGTFHQQPYSTKGSEIIYTQLQGGFRRSYPLQDSTLSDKPKLVLIGGSYTRGNAISDDETFPWKLQQRLPELEILNYGVGGYGTLQSLMALEQFLPTIRQRKLVIYGLIGHHSQRNVSTTSWISTLSRFRVNDLYIPYVKIVDNERIQRQPPLHFSPFPLRENSALISLIEQAWISIRWRKHNDEPLALITTKLVSEMKKQSSKHDADFLVVLLSVNEKAAANYMKIFSNSGIKALNCSFPLTRDMIVIGEGHPNGRMNTKWAHCIGSYLDVHKDS